MTFNGYENDDWGQGPGVPGCGGEALGAAWVTASAGC
jgi:hypothetical protein